MKPAICLRIAAVLTFIHAVLHTIGGVFSGPAPGPASTAVLAMKANQFLLMGNTRSYWEFYRGLGLAVSVALTAEAVVMWQLGSLARLDAQGLRPIFATLMVAYAALAVNSYAYFFLLPVMVEVLIAVCLGLAIAAAKPDAVVSGESARIPNPKFRIVSPETDLRS